jgi:transposase-like protein
MPRRCTVCDHTERHGIDEALVSGAPYRGIAKRFGLSESAVYRHKSEHLPAHLLKASEVEEAAQADDLLSQVRDLQSRTLAILEEAHDSGEHRTALLAIGQARANLEFQARLLQFIKEGPTINVQLSSEWMELRAVIISALEPYEAARRAVVGALEGAGDGSSS